MNTTLKLLAGWEKQLLFQWDLKDRNIFKLLSSTWNNIKIIQNHKQVNHTIPGAEKPDIIEISLFLSFPPSWEHAGLCSFIWGKSHHINNNSPFSQEIWEQRHPALECWALSLPSRHSENFPLDAAGPMRVCLLSYFPQRRVTY